MDPWPTKKTPSLSDRWSANANIWCVLGAVVFVWWVSLQASRQFRETDQFLDTTLKHGNMTISHPSLLGVLLGRHPIMRAYWPNGRLLREGDAITGTYKAYFQDGSLLQEYDGHVRKSYDSPGRLGELIDYDRHIFETYYPNRQVKEHWTFTGQDPTTQWQTCKKFSETGAITQAFHRNPDGSTTYDQ
jgi:hypothetical protein